MNKYTIENIKTKLALKPLEGEGGFFRETYKTENSSAIYYLIGPNDFSALHKLKSDEVFHFYAGDPVEMVQINSRGELKTIILGQLPSLQKLMGDNF